MSIGHWQNDNGRGRLKYLHKNLHQVYSVQQKSYTDYLRTEPKLHSEKLLHTNHMKAQSPAPLSLPSGDLSKDFPNKILLCTSFAHLKCIYPPMTLFYICYLNNTSMRIQFMNTFIKYFI